MWHVICGVAEAVQQQAFERAEVRRLVSTARAAGFLLSRGNEHFGTRAGLDVNRRRRDNAGVLGLRSFRDEDGEAVWRLHDFALEDAGAHGGSGPWEDDLRDIPATYLDSRGDFLVGFVAGELVAMGGLLLLSRGEAEVRRMRVHPNFQRQGLGGLLLKRLEERAQALGCQTIRLDTTNEQTAARRLYERSGYRETGRRQTDRFLFIDYAKTRERA